MKFLISIIFSIQLYATTLCQDREFTITSNTFSYLDTIYEISKECKLGIVFKDAHTKELLKNSDLDMPIVNFKVETILNMLLLNLDINYSIVDNRVVNISSLITKTFHLDYMKLQRVSQSSTNVNISDSKSDSNKIDTKIDREDSSGSKVFSTLKSNFWDNLKLEIESILIRPEDWYKSSNSVINSYAGLITVTGTNTQVNRVSNYLNLLNSKTSRQVLLDVYIINIEFNQEKKSGIDWRELQSIFDINISLESSNSSDALNKFNIFRVDNSLSLDNLFKHFKEFGNLELISNPQILALNNQTALISVGEQIYYKRLQTTTSTSNHTTTSQSETIDSIFSGVVLDITPTINESKEIILKINPSISSMKNSNIVENRTIPPDLVKKQLSTVVKVTNNERVVLGGLVNSRDDNTNIDLPIFKNIPILGSFFSFQTKNRVVSEMIIIITPKVID